MRNVDKENQDMNRYVFLKGIALLFIGIFKLDNSNIWTK